MQRILGGTVLERMGIGAVTKMNFIKLGAHKDSDTVRLLKQVRRERKSLVSGDEAFLVYSLARSVRDLPGDMAEVGVFEGSTARLICEAKGEKRLRLFDTFEGLPAGGDEDLGVHREHQYSCSRESVESYLQGHGYRHVTYHEGVFPESTHDVEEAEYCFVHLDVDLYASTLDCLNYFYDRLVPGGILLSHDYSLLAGVKQAFTEFLEDKPEGLIELPTTQCMFVKLSSIGFEAVQPSGNQASVAAPHIRPTQTQP